MNPSSKALSLIRQFEGLRLSAYICPAGVPTIGYGTTKGVKMGDTITEEEAERLLEKDVSPFAKTISSLVKVQLNQNQFDALVCFVYNIGPHALASSTMLKLINQGLFDDAANQFVRWNKANGEALAGLTRRRMAERDLFLRADK